MKILLTSALLLLALSACFARQPEPFVSFITSTVVPPPPAPPTPADFIADLDFLLDTLRENFGYFYTAKYELDYDIAYKIRGLQAELAALEAAGEELSVLHFHRRLRHTFETVNFIGHLQFINPTYANRFMSREALLQQEYYNDLTGHVATEFFAGYQTSSTRMFERLMRIRSFYHGGEVAESLQNALATQDIPAIRATIDQSDHVSRIHHQVLTEDIAYLAFHSLLFSWESEDWEDLQLGLAEFYRQIQDFEHLIIDIRGNPGGFHNIFMNYIIMPLRPLADDFHLDLFHMGTDTLAISSDVRWSAIDHTRAQLFGNGDLTLLDLDMRPLEDMLDTFPMPSLNHQSIQNLTQGFRVRLHRPNNTIPQFHNLYFDGNIWLLTDGITGSNAHLFAYVAKASGFATLVGEPTGGNAGFISYRPVFTLPHSHIEFEFDQGAMFTSHGRSMEHGIEPHYPNRPGLCALETVLAIIAEQESN